MHTCFFVLGLTFIQAISYLILVTNFAMLIQNIIFPFLLNLPIMIRRQSRSFADKQPIPNILPPLHKQQSNSDNNEQNKIPSTNRPTFVIRKRNSSFTESLTTRKTGKATQNLQNSKQMKKENTIHENKNTPNKYHKQIPKRQALKSRDSNKDDAVSICNIQFEEDFVSNQINMFKKKEKEYVGSNNIFDNAATTKSLIKRPPKKRKIQQCKIIKINWGSKNGMFDLGLSAIKQNEGQVGQAPIDSLHQLYAQIDY